MNIRYFNNTDFRHLLRLADVLLTSIFLCTAGARVAAFKMFISCDFSLAGHITADSFPASNFLDDEQPPLRRSWQTEEMFTQRRLIFQPRASRR